MRNFMATERDQLYLMPPSVTEWLPADHLAWFVLDSVDQFDLAAFYARYREDGWGRPAYDPKMLVALLVYAYCVGERSSRKIERRCTEDVAFRVIAANHQPDHATISRFRAEHAGALSGLFADVLRLCAEAGLVNVGSIAVDGTKVEANASPLKMATAEGIKAIVERILSEAAATDAEEDERYGKDARGDELPEVLRSREGRIAKLREVKARLDAEDAAKRDAIEAKQRRRREIEAGVRKPRGRSATERDPGDFKHARANLTDPDAKVMKTTRSFICGYNAQLAVDDNQVILAARVSDQASDGGQFEPTLRAALDNVAAADIDQPVDVVVADAGYFSEHNVRLDVGAQIYIAPDKAAVTAFLAETDEDPGEMPASSATFAEACEVERARRKDILDRWITGAITAKQATAELGTVECYAYELRKRYQTSGHVSSSPNHSRLGRQGPRIKLADWMRKRLTTPAGRAIYQRRSQTIEPVFGQMKEIRGLRRFARRGLEACDAEWKLAATAHNLLKIWRRRTPVLAG